MKKHIKIYDVETKCLTCGTVYHLKSSTPKISLDACSHCHPFYTDEKSQKVATGQVEKFIKRYKISGSDYFLRSQKEAEDLKDKETKPKAPKVSSKK
ncbi:50S ribosomal protein L31 [Mycoplasma sp. SG1]|uniref:50S ribosomal protein L31 n=1 Tax=Mycoplasma sp. SG1 TaxID=2810348 RepID=UPI0020246095|nr:50S ribosomal protein L31 [Mycoplasma sp. SG1]URM52860.1 50S ribosomal protein L31 [Mycoplasma sp. SG1]